MRDVPVTGWLRPPAEFKAGLYWIPAEEYHARPELSSTTARRLLPPSCPALAKYERDHPVVKSAFDRGSVAHRLVLGAGDDYIELEYDNWRSAAAQSDQKLARECGLVPLLSHELRQAEAMAAAVLADPVAGPLFAPGMGIAERTILFARDGVNWRAMLDWLITAPGGPPVVVDVKTTGRSAHPTTLGKTVADYGYHQQAAAYLDAAYSIGLDGTLFLFVFVEKDPPHLVTVAQPDVDDISAGYEANARAAAVWAECLETGVWPSYATDVVTVRRPRWAR